MCGLCAALNSGRSWTHAAGKPQFSLAGKPIHVSKEREQLVRIVNAALDHYGVTVSDWGGGSYLAANRAGRNENVYGLGELWGSVDALLPGVDADPLDEALMDSLERLAARGLPHA